MSRSERASMASLGGKARADKLDAEDRKNIARAAAEARWSKRPEYSLLPKETHTGTLMVGEREIPCSVLENGVRVFSIRGMHRLMGTARRGGKREAVSGGALLPTFLASPAIKPFIPDDLMVALISPIQYRPKHGGRTAFGYNATLLPGICEVILDADRKGVIRETQKQVPGAARILLGAFARVGVIALVDEATGYQQDRARDELNRILEAYISKELLPWTKRFPDEFFKQVFRLHGWEYREGSVQSPRYLGKFTNKVVYEPMPPGVLRQLRKLNPPNEAGYRKHRHHQFLTPDTGHPHLDKQITAVTTLMRISDEKDEFWRNFHKAFPKKGDQIPFEYGEPEPLEIK